jgi:hypothetical protein
MAVVILAYIASHCVASCVVCVCIVVKRRSRRNVTEHADGK